MMSEQNDDYRKLLDEKFNSLHSNIDLKFDNVNSQLKVISEQTIKTNGRLLKTEETIKILEKNEMAHKYNCPQQDRFKKIESDVQSFKDEKSKDVEVAFIRKYPKLSVGILAVCVFLMISSWGSYIKTSENNVIMKEVKTLENNSIKLQNDIQTLNLKIEEIKKVK